VAWNWVIPSKSLERFYKK